MSSQNDTRETLIFLAKLADQSERYEDLMDYMKQVAIHEGELSVEERNMFSMAYKNVIGNKRASWRIVSGVEHKEENRHAPNAVHIALIKQYHGKIESELETICNEVLSIITDSLLPKTSSAESKVFYHKMKGDYYRYLAEFQGAEARKETAAKSLESYQAATEIAHEELAPTNPLRLGLALNFSVFYYEIMDAPEKACKLAKQAFDDTLAELDTLSEESYKDSTLIMQLLNDNLLLWNNDIENNQAAAAAAAAAATNADTTNTDTDSANIQN